MALVERKPSGGRYTELIYRADPGERNVFALSPDGSGVTIEDPGVRLRVGPGCRLRGASVASCEGDVDVALIVLGDHDDSAKVLRVPDLSAEALGGAGSDFIQGTSAKGGGGDDHLVGSRFQDTLEGGPGSDLLEGRAGNDVLTDRDGRRRDRYIGGAGIDRVSYSFSRNPVKVDLGRGVGGIVGESDALETLEDASGGSGDDSLAGDSGPNFLDGREGSDRLFGRVGTDRLFGANGSDDLKGGDGPDRLVPDRSDALPSKALRDRSDGGRGNDRVEGSPIRDLVIGGPGDDLIYGAANYEGSKAPNFLRGGPGNDRVYGSEGPDRVSGGPGTDTIAGLAGPDTLLSRDGQADVVGGGPGEDRARIDRRLDSVFRVEALF